MKHIISILISMFVTISGFSQGPGEPYHPMTAPGANGIALTGHILIWENPAGTVFNEVYFSDDSLLVAAMDSSVKIANGLPSTVFIELDLSNVANLSYDTKYFWSVVEYDTLSYTAGPVWYFTSSNPPNNPLVFFDDFENGDGNWAIETVSGCPWSVVLGSDYGYTLPPTSTGNVMSADADECGSGGGGSTGSITLNNGIDVSEGSTLR